MNQNITKRNLLKASLQKQMVVLGIVGSMLLAITVIDNLLSRKDSLLNGEFIVMIVVMIFILALVSMHTPLKALRRLHKQEQLLDCDFEKALRGKRLINGIYRDSKWFVGVGTSYLLIYNKQYINTIRIMDRGVRVTSAEIMTKDNRKIKLIVGAMDFNLIRQLEDWVND